MALARSKEVIHSHDPTPDFDQQCRWYRALLGWPSLVVTTIDPVLTPTVLQRGLRFYIAQTATLPRVLGDSLFAYDNASAKQLRDRIHQTIGQNHCVSEYHDLVRSMATKHVLRFVTLAGQKALQDTLNLFAADL